MKIRKVKKHIGYGIQQVIENAHDIAVTHQVLWYLHAKVSDRGKTVIIRENPFFNKELNGIFHFLNAEIDQMLKR